jgi:hypothetical protein
MIGLCCCYILLPACSFPRPAPFFLPPNGVQLFATPNGMRCAGQFNTFYQVSPSVDRSGAPASVYTAGLHLAAHHICAEFNRGCTCNSGCTVATLVRQPFAAAAAAAAAAAL